MAPQVQNQKGQVLVLFAALIVILMGMAALAVDIGRAYGVKAKLNAAVDVASIAAGRVVGQGQSAAQNQAQSVFNANYASGMLGSNVTGVNPVATQNADGSWTITVTATASLPTVFAPVLPSGLQAFPIQASATCNVRTLDMVLVLDSSGSLTVPSTTPALLRSAAINFIGKFDPANDRVGLIHFGSGAVSDVTMTVTKGFNQTAIENAINTINPDVNANTASAEAMRLAQMQLDAIPTASQNSLRVIVLFTDGAPNTIGCNFGGIYNPADLYSQKGNLTETAPATSMYATNQLNVQLASFAAASLPSTDHTGTVNLQSDLIPPTRTLITAGTSIVNSQCNVNRAARSMLENVANAARSETGTPIRIFTIGLGASLTSLEVTNGSCGYGTSESGQNILRRLANVKGVDTYNPNQLSGIYTWAQNANQLNAVFQQVASEILRLSQ